MYQIPNELYKKANQIMKLYQLQEDCPNYTWES